MSSARLLTDQDLNTEMRAFRRHWEGQGAVVRFFEALGDVLFTISPPEAPMQPLLERTVQAHLQLVLRNSVSVGGAQ